MKVLVVLCAVVASCLASPYTGYAYSAISPLTGYSSIAAPYSYAYSAPIISAVPYAAPYAPIAPITPVAPAAVKTQYHSQDELGQAHYGHTEPLQAHDAVQDAHGNKIGSFSYVDPVGAVHRRDYVADSLGFRVAANDLPVAPAGPGPVVPAETPEVVAAKIHHFAAHGAAAALHYRRRRNAYYYGPHALPIVTPSGHLADTPEVAAAKAAHFAEHARQAGHAVPYAAPYAHAHYAGPYAAPIVTPSGHLADTPEVAAAKAAHFAEHAKQSGHAIAYAAPYAHGHYAGHYAAPIVTPSGFLADTPEVAAAKAAHFAEHAARGKRSIFYQTPASTTPLAAPVAYAAPVVHPVPAFPAVHAYAAPVLGVPAIKTDIVHNPGHAHSYRIDSPYHF